MLILHILIAMASLFISAFGIIKPSGLVQKLSAGLVVATVLSGSLLVILHGAHLKQACVAGLVYLSVCSPMMLAGRYRLARQLSRD